ncbi:dienelactone hydrolase family protein [Futiania mangrovi]|uniref:Dienelactone hydrolase family protein n=1 Tax=Futiania mangrovi TaxID=2959716 RepID=A0A9J6PM20_9PROT|nr:dienelactone hydrolase family protein [Futiania mangrovii]MCP1337703.1 dienelactone hydrolase family protein [Futiania mangrovii]
MDKRDIVIDTADGQAKATVFGDKGGPGAIVYMDAFGPRPGLDSMAERLAAAGYTVLVPDLFYREAPYGPFDAATAFDDPEKRAQIMHLMKVTTQDMSVRDTAAFLDALAAEGAGGPVGVVGYCMGGARALNAAAAYPDRIAAAASFHGGGLASDAPDSPHRRAGSIRARVYVASAGVDGSFPPEQSASLAQALREAEVDHIIENYMGKLHGWAVPDHKVFDAEGAERHWTRLLTLFAETLKV